MESGSSLNLYAVGLTSRDEQDGDVGRSVQRVRSFDRVLLESTLRIHTESPYVNDLEFSEPTMKRNARERDEHFTVKSGWEPLRFIIAKGGTQNWIVVETHGLYGGVFVSKDAAIRFVDRESRDRQATVEIMAASIERLERGDNGKLDGRKAGSDSRD
jgi:hypothetical protein